MASRNLRRFSAARSFSRLRLDLGELGDPVDQPRDVLAEQLLDLVGRRERVLDRVVQDRGDDRLVVEMQVGEDAGHLDRMAEIGVARGAGLGAVRLHREDIGAVDQRLVGVGVVGPDFLDEFILSQHVPKMGECAAVVQARKEGGRAEGSDGRPHRGMLIWLRAPSGAPSGQRCTSRALGQQVRVHPPRNCRSGLPASQGTGRARAVGSRWSSPDRHRGPQLQVMSRVTKRSLVGAAVLAE